MQPISKSISSVLIATVALLGSINRAADPLDNDLSPNPGEQQLPTAMHSQMEERPRIKVGQRSGDLIGNDHRALQAAVDYVAGLGGGTVEIGEGEFLMRDSLHLRSRVTVRGTSGKTILRKAPAAISPLVLDGDFFRNETLGMSGHRNRLEDNLIENNGSGDGTAAGIRIRGETSYIVIRNNVIRDTRPEGSQTQSVGIRIEKSVGSVELQKNLIKAKKSIQDERKTD